MMPAPPPIAANRFDQPPIDRWRQPKKSQFRLAPSRRGARNPSEILLALASAAVAVSGYSIAREWGIDTSRSAIERQSLQMAQEDDRWRSTPIDAPDSAAPARTLIADALATARVASALPVGDRRAALLTRARLEIETARQRRPHWGDAWVLSAFIYSLQTQGMSEEERLALIRSYLDAPLLRDGGLWRTTRVLNHWNAFPRSVQDDAITETAWLLRVVRSDQRAALFEAVRQSPAYVPIFRRWSAMR